MYMIEDFNGYILTSQDREIVLTKGIILAWCGSTLSVALIWDSCIKWVAGHAGSGIIGIIVALILGTTLVNLGTMTGTSSPIWLKRSLISLYAVLVLIVGLMELAQLYFYIMSLKTDKLHSISEWWAAGPITNVAPWAISGIVANSISVFAALIYGIVLLQVTFIHRRYAEAERRSYTEQNFSEPFRP